MSRHRHASRHPRPQRPLGRRPAPAPRSRSWATAAAVVAVVVLLGGGIRFVDPARAAEPDIRVGIIGLDTSHAIAFTELMNRPDDARHVPGARVVAAYPQGSRDIESSVSRVPGYTEKIRELGVEIVPSIAALVAGVDAVLLESNDGRVHLEQAVPVLAAGKPVFIDKPMAASLADVIAIFTLARGRGTPVFSSSSLRYGVSTQAVRHGSIGRVLGCDTHSPCSMEATHPDFFWYGIHGCEALFTVLGTGCQTVRRTTAAQGELITGVWDGGRIGTYRGLTVGPSTYGGTAFGTDGIAAVGENSGYRPLVVDIVEFFRTGRPPVDERETIELFAFMEAADESRRLEGGAVAVADIIAKAETAAADLVRHHRETPAAAPTP
jgi:predicted dehydrogenase